MDNAKRKPSDEHIDTRAKAGGPYAGNPYVAPSQCYGVTSRFDVGEVASAAGLRRGALLYMEARKIIQKMGGKS